MARFTLRKKRKFDRTSKLSYYEGKEGCAMKKNTVLNKDLCRLDNIVKDILSYAIIQAAILKYFFKEFKDYSINELEIKVLGVMPGDKITPFKPNLGVDDYMSIIYFTKENDVMTAVVGVDVHGPIDNFEAFNNLLLFQAGVVQFCRFERPLDEYVSEDLIKSMTCWIVTAKYPGYSGIYRFSDEELIPEAEYPKDVSKFITTNVLFLDYDINSTHPGLRLLNIFFSYDLSPSEKEVLLDEYFNGLNLEIKEKVREMCTYSIGVYNNGFTEGEIKRTVTLMEEFGFSKDEIIKRLITDNNCDKLKANAYYDKYSKK